MAGAERTKLAAISLLLTLAATGLTPGAASARGGGNGGGGGGCVGASITVSVSPNTVDARGNSNIKVQSQVTNCGSTAATYTVTHSFAGNFGQNNGFCLHTLTPDSRIVSVAPGESALVLFYRGQPSCLGGYTVNATVTQGTTSVADGQDTFTITQKTRRNP